MRISEMYYEDTHTNHLRANWVDHNCEVQSYYIPCPYTEAISLYSWEDKDEAILTITCPTKMSKIYLRYDNYTIGNQ